MDIIPKEFSPEFIEGPDDESLILRTIQERVDYLMEYDIDLLFSYLYRLDVSEKSINLALGPNSPIPGNQAIARLILDRQKKRIETKKKYKQPPIEGWEF